MARSSQTSHDEPRLDDAPRGVVVGVDGSAGSEVAARWAAQEARRRDLPLTILHAFHLPDAAATAPPDYAEHRRAEGRMLAARTASAIKTLHPELLVTTELSDHSAAHALQAAGRAAALIVTGTRGRGGFTGMLLGSVSRALAAHATCPLVVVPGQTALGPGGKVVLGVGPRHSEAAIQYAFEAAQRHGAALTVARAWWPAPWGATMGSPGGMYELDPGPFRQNSKTDVLAAIKPLRDEYPDVTVRVEIPDGNAVDALLQAARSARLLVVGTHRRHGPLTVGAGYVVDGVIAHSRVPVAVVPAGD
jgi:nucleotide-binding universal stress UspA family protein